MGRLKATLGSSLQKKAVAKLLNYIKDILVTVQGRSERSPSKLNHSPKATLGKPVPTKSVPPKLWPFWTCLNTGGPVLALLLCLREFYQERGILDIQLKEKRKKKKKNLGVWMACDVILWFWGFYIVIELIRLWTGMFLPYDFVFYSLDYKFLELRCK